MEPAERYLDYDEWEIPGGAFAELIKDEATIVAPPSLTPQDRRILARLVWSMGAPDRANPGVPAEGKGSLYQCLVRISFPHQKREGCRASMLTRITARASGTRRRENDPPMFDVCSGDASGLIAARFIGAEQISARSARPANEMARATLKPHSSWDTDDICLPVDKWLAAQKLGAPSVSPHVFPR